MKKDFVLSLPSSVFYPKSDASFFIDPLCLEISKGEWIAFCGPSGMGKSTLLKALAGLLEEEYILKDKADEAFAQQNTPQKFGFLSPKEQLLPWLSLEKNIALFDVLNHKRPKKDRVMALMEMMDLSDLSKKVKPKILSSGMNQRILLARTLYACPDIMFLDEPFSHLDTLLKKNIIQKMQTDYPNVSVIVITHDVAEEQFAHRIFDMKRHNHNPQHLKMIQRHLL